MIADHFWKILFVLMVLTGIVFWFVDFKKKRAFNTTAVRLAEMIAFGEDTKPETAEEAHSRFISAVTLLYEHGQAGGESRPLLDAAHESNDDDPDSPYARLVNSALDEGVRAARDMGIFTDEAMWDLNEGQAVPVTKGPFEGEAIAVSPIVHPDIAKPAEFFPGNLALVPESVAAINRDLELTEKLHATSNKLQTAGILSSEEANDIKKAYYRYRK